MKRAFLILCFTALFLCGVSSAAVRLRPQSSRADSLTMTLCGNLLCTEEGGRTIVYAPFRRRSPAGGDEGMIAKFYVEGGRVTRAWTTSAGARTILTAPAEQSRFIPGALVKADESVGAIASATGLDVAQVKRLNSFYLGKNMGAPYPVAMTLPEGVLYVQTDDGLICALDASNGRELWAFIPPQVLRKERVESLLNAPDDMPWLLAGALTAEKIDEDGAQRVLLWGTLGDAGSGLYCLDITAPETPLFSWAREKLDDGTETLWGVSDQVTLDLGDSAAAPVVAPVSSNAVLMLPSGAGAQGRLWALAPTSGEYLHSCTGEEGIALMFSPLATQSANGRITRITVCDDAGGVQEFVRKDAFFELSYRLDLRARAGIEELDLLFSPLLCPLPHENWLAFIASSENATVAAACPAPLRERSWSDLPWRGGGWGWYHRYEGFHSVVSALFFDGLLYLLGREEGRAVVKIIDVNGSRLEKTVEAAQDSVTLAVADGKVQVLSAGDGTLTAASVSAPTPPAAAILYTLYR